MSLQTDTILNERYALVRQLGKGAFGEVWLANDLQLGIEVAVKVYVALDGNGCREFGREYVRMRSLSHTNLLRADHYALFGDRPFLVMEYCPSGAKELIGNADELTLLRFIRDVASGLAFMHEHDILHRDIKPDNILRKADGTFVLTDFGLSKNMHSTLLRNSSRNMSSESVDDLFSGTVEYMAPELFTADPLAVKATDVWALGVTLYEIITGELPFFGKGGNMMNYGAAVPNIHAPLTDNMKDTVKACMSKEPWNRPTAQSLADWAREALIYLSETGYESLKVNYSSPTDSLGTGASVPYVPPVEEQSQPEPEPDPDPLTLEPHTEKRRHRVWPWLVAASLVALVVLGFVAGAKIVVPKPKADAKFFAECKKKNDIGLYRAYVKQYPKGDSLAIAQAWIAQWEQDSVNQASAKPAGNKVLADNSAMSKDKKAEKKTDELTQNDSENPMSMDKKAEKDADKNKKKDLKEKEKKEKAEDERLVEEKRKAKDSKKDNPSDYNEESGNDSKRDEKNISTKNLEEKSTTRTPEDVNPDVNNPRLTPVGNNSNKTNETQDGFTPAGKTSDKSISKKNGDSEEEQAANEAKTMERCCSFVEKYGDKSKYYTTVKKNFKILYEKKLAVCKSVEDCERFLKEHDGCMRKMRLDGSAEDRNWRSRAETKKKELEGKKNELESPKGISPDEPLRPEPGTKPVGVSKPVPGLSPKKK